MITKHLRSRVPALAAMWAMISGSSTCAAEEVPNIVIMIADQLRHQSCGYLGPVPMAVNPCGTGR
jgi:hypothetical protein